MRILRPLREFLSAFELRSTGKWFLLSGLVGLVAGLGAIAFQFLLQVVLRFALGGIAGYYPHEAAGEHLMFGTDVTDFSDPYLLLRVVAVMAAGGLVSGFLVYSFAPEAEGHGTDAAIEAFHHKRGFIRPMIPVIKMLASAVTIGTGGSGGREGPIAQIGAGFGSFLATRLRLSPRDRRLMLAAGVGAGVGAIFRAPLAGALFAGEILYRDADFESEAIVPAAIASITSYTVYSLSLPSEMRFLPLFGRSLQFELGSLLELLPLAVFALILVLAGILYVKVFYGTHRLFAGIPFKKHLRPALGALLAGIFTIGLFMLSSRDERVLAVLSAGYGIIQDSLALEAGVDALTHVPVGILLAVAGGKIVTTSLTIGSGGSGGVFGPSMVIGACLGAAVGQWFQGLQGIWPGIVSDPGAYVIIGMAGFFAGIASAPFSTIIMVSELTGNYELLLAAMWVSTLSFLLCRRWTLYQKQVPTRLESPAHRGDFVVDVLEGCKVGDVFKPGRPLVTVPESAPLSRIVHLLAETHQTYFPVVDGESNMVGIFSANDVRSYLYDESIWAVTIARDVMVTDVLSVTLEDDLNTALRRFTTRNIDELPVLDPDRPGTILGMLRRKETIAFYNRQLVTQKHSHAEDRASP